MPPDPEEEGREQVRIPSEPEPGAVAASDATGEATEPEAAAAEVAVGNDAEATPGENPPVAKKKIVVVEPFLQPMEQRNFQSRIKGIYYAADNDVMMQVANICNAKAAVKASKLNKSKRKKAQDALAWSAERAEAVERSWRKEQEVKDEEERAIEAAGGITAHLADGDANFDGTAQAAQACCSYASCSCFNNAEQDVPGLAKASRLGTARSKREAEGAFARKGFKSGMILVKNGAKNAFRDHIERVTDTITRIEHTRRFELLRECCSRGLETASEGPGTCCRLLRSESTAIRHDDMHVSIRYCACVGSNIAPTVGKFCEHLVLNVLARDTLVLPGDLPQCPPNRKSHGLCTYVVVTFLQDDGTPTKTCFTILLPIDARLQVVVRMVAAMKLQNFLKLRPPDMDPMPVETHLNEILWISATEATAEVHVLREAFDAATELLGGDDQEIFDVLVRRDNFYWLLLYTLEKCLRALQGHARFFVAQKLNK